MSLLLLLDLPAVSARLNNLHVQPSTEPLLTPPWHTLLTSCSAIQHCLLCHVCAGSLCKLNSQPMQIPGCSLQDSILLCPRPSSASVSLVDQGGQAHQEPHSSRVGDHYCSFLPGIAYAWILHCFQCYLILVHRQPHHCVCLPNHSSNLLGQETFYTWTLQSG
jgi:hypothetical protein